MGSPGVVAPTRSQMFRRGLTGRCAVCGKFRLARTWVHVDKTCSQCGFPIERKDGHLVGAVGMNTIVTFGAMLITFVVAALILGSGTAPVTLILVVAPVMLVVSVVFFPISKTLWSAMDLMFVALEPGEVDPRYDPSVTLDEAG